MWNLVPLTVLSPHRAHSQLKLVLLFLVSDEVRQACRMIRKISDWKDDLVSKPVEQLQR